MCTTVIVGKAVSKTGRVIVGHNEDSGGRVLHQQFYVPGGKHAAGEMLVAEPGRAQVPEAAETVTTYWSNMLQIDGSSFDQGFANAAGVVLCSNGGGSSFDGDDPDEASLKLKDGGVGFLLRRVIAERAHTAREGVEIAAKLLDEYGYFGSARNYTIADKDEAWCLNVVKGHHYVAKRIPDDKVMLISNMLAIRSVDINDHENVIASPGLIEYAIEKGRYTPKVPGDYSDFDFAMAYQSDENRHAPTKSVRMRLGWHAITGDYYKDELHYPEILPPAAPMGVEDVIHVLGLTCYESYATRGDGREDAFHVSARDISRSQTRESWVCDLTEDPLFMTMWRCTSYQDTGVYIPWFPMSGKIPEGYQWMTLEEARANHFHLKPEYLNYDLDHSYFLYATVGELTNFNRGLLPGVLYVKKLYMSDVAERTAKVVEKAKAAATREEAAEILGNFTCDECKAMDTVYEALLDAINLHTMHVDVETLSVKDEGKVEVVLFGSPEFNVEGLDLDTVYWSLGFTGKKESVNAPAKPIDCRFEDWDGDGIVDAVLTFNAKDVAQWAIPGARIDTYLRGLCNLIRFVAMDEVEFVA